jgi:hypothetical protein
MKFVTLPSVVQIAGTTHVMHYRDSMFAVYQNYSSPVESSRNPLVQPAPGVQGTSLYHLFRIINHEPSEELGPCVGTFSDLTAAIDQAARTQ